MKILHVIPTYLPAVRYGGPVFAVHGLCRELAELGHEVHVYTTSIDGPGNLEVPVGVPVERDGVRVSYFEANQSRRLAVASGMKARLHETLASFDVLHIHSIFLWPPWIAARVARRRRVPYVISPRGMLVRDLIERRSRLAKTAWLRWMERKNLERAAAMHFTSDLEHEEATRLGIPMRRAAVIPNGVDLHEMASAANGSANAELDELLAGGPFVLSLGRIHWKKGLDQLIVSLRFAPQVRAVIAGNDEEGYRNTLEKLAADHGVRDRVFFSGAIYGPAKWRLLRAARALVLPSQSENFANVVLEAMASERAVVVSRGVGLAEIVQRAGCGIVVEAQPADLGAALNRLWNDEDLRRAMGAKGRELVEREYQWSKIAPRMLQLYREITAP